MIDVCEVVKGKKFVAGIKMYGTALVTKEKDTWWIYGVNPGAIAVAGRTLDAAFNEFRRDFRRYLLEVIESPGVTPPSFRAFEKEIQRFFHECDNETKNEWVKAASRANNKFAYGYPRNKYTRRVEVTQFKTRSKKTKMYETDFDNRMAICG